MIKKDAIVGNTDIAIFNITILEGWRLILKKSCGWWKSGITISLPERLSVQTCTI